MKQTHLSQTQIKLLHALTRATTSSQALVRRVNIILAGTRTINQVTIAQEMEVNRATVHLWLERWDGAAAELELMETEYTAERLSEPAYQRGIIGILADAPRPGHPPTISEDQRAQIIALAAEKPEDADVPITNWTCDTLRQAVIDQGILPSISRSHIGRFLKECHAQTAS